MTTLEGGSVVVMDDRQAAEAAASAEAAAQMSAAGAVRSPSGVDAAGAQVPVPVTGPEALQPTAATAWATAVIVPGPDGAPPDGAVLQAVPAPAGEVTTRAADGCRTRAENAGTSTSWVAYTPLSTGADPWTARTLLSSQIQDDATVQAATAAWSQCLADAGYPGMAALSDPVTSIIQGSATLPATDGTPDATALQALRSREVALAVTDHDCRESVGLAAARTAAQRALEQQYVDAHQAELEPYREAVNGGG